MKIAAENMLFDTQELIILVLWFVVWVSER